MSLYPSPADINWSNGFQEVPMYLNSVTNNLIMPLILLAVYVIVASAFYLTKKDVFGGIAIAGYSVFVLGVLLWVGNLLGDVYFGITIALAILGLATLWIPRSD